MKGGILSVKWLSITFFLVALLISAIGAIRSSLLPEQEFLTSTIIDDAVYYLIPAQNLLDGHGYSFDKIHKTNGVQPAWAAVALLIAVLCPDRLAAMRLLVLLGGLLWLSAGVLLFLTLYRRWPALSLVSSVVWLFTGFTHRLALQGMENGLTGFLLALMVWLGARFLHSRGPKPIWFYGVLGLVAAAVSLSRVEMIILPFLLTIATLFGVFDQSDRLRAFYRQAAAIACPTLLLFGAYIVINLVLPVLSLL